MDRVTPLTRHALAALALAACALAGCGKPAPDGTASDTAAGDSRSTADAGATSPGMSGSPGSGGRDSASATAGVDPNALPPTAAGHAASALPGSRADAGGTTQALGPAERKFVTEAAAGGQFEVQAGKLAAEKATDPKVKQYAAMLVTDHSNAGDELKAFASAHNVSLPTSLPKELQAKLDRLQKASGEAFDKQYAQDVGLKDHKEDIARFEKASREAKNPELKAWVEKTLPTLREHLAAAQKLPQNGAKRG